MNRSIAAILGIVTIALVQPATIAAEVNGSQAAAAKKYFAAGVSKYKSGDNQGALAAYDRAIQLNPRYALAYVNREVIRSVLRSPRKAIAIDPNYAQAYNNRGAAKDEVGAKRGAIADYDRASAISPRFAAAFYNRGATRYELRRRGALDDYNRAIASDPEYSAAYTVAG